MTVCPIDKSHGPCPHANGQPPVVLSCLYLVRAYMPVSGYRGAKTPTLVPLEGTKMPIFVHAGRAKAAEIDHLCQPRPGSKAHFCLLEATPPPRSGEKNPTFWRNVPASRFFSKRGSQCPGSQSQGPNTPSFWFFCSWSNVETQSSPHFAKIFFHLWVCTWFLITCTSESATGPVVYALVCRLASVSSNPDDYQPKFLHFLSLGSDLHPKLSFLFMQKQG